MTISATFWLSLRKKERKKKKCRKFTKVRNEQQELESPERNMTSGCSEFVKYGIRWDLSRLRAVSLLLENL